MPLSSNNVIGMSAENISVRLVPFSKELRQSIKWRCVWSYGLALSKICVDFHELVMFFFGHYVE